MPITPSAKKALRQNKKRRGHNRLHKNRIKNLTKKALILAREGKKDELKKLIPLAYKALDKAAKVGVLKKNTASRRKSKMSKFLK